MAPCDWVRAHVESGFGGDAVEDHTEHDGKRHANLFAESQPEKQALRGENTSCHHVDVKPAGLSHH